MKIQQKIGYHHGNLKETLIDVAIQEIKERGTINLSLRQLAQKCGVSQSAPYRHFRDKQHLIAVITGHGYKLLTEMAEKVQTESDLPEVRLRKICLTYVQFAMKNNALFNLMTGPDSFNKNKYPDLLKSADECFSRLIKTLASLTGKPQTLREDDTFALLTYAVIHGVTILLVNGQIRRAKTKKEQEKIALDVIDAFIKQVK